MMQWGDMKLVNLITFVPNLVALVFFGVIEIKRPPGRKQGHKCWSE